MKFPKKISQKILCKTPWRDFIEKKFEERDMNAYSYFTTWCHGNKYGTMIFPITKSWDIVILKEFRAWIEDIVYNFPIWAHEEHLTAEENCRKELKEETGYSSERFLEIGETIVENYSDGKIKYFFASNCIAWEPELEIWENIETLVVSKEIFITMIENGTINCPLTISCFTFAQLKKLI